MLWQLGQPAQGGCEGARPPLPLQQNCLQQREPSFSGQGRPSGPGQGTGRGYQPHPPPPPYNVPDRRATVHATTCGQQSGYSQPNMASRDGMCDHLHMPGLTGRHSDTGGSFVNGGPARHSDTKGPSLMRGGSLGHAPRASSFTTGAGLHMPFANRPSPGGGGLDMWAMAARTGSGQGQGFAGMPEGGNRFDAYAYHNQLEQLITQMSLQH